MRTQRIVTAVGSSAAALILVAGLGTVHWRKVQAQSLWRGLVVAPEQRCSPYKADEYRYSQSVEDRIVTELGGVYGPYTGRWFASKSETDIERTSWLGRRPTTAGCVRPTAKPGASSRWTC